MIVLFVPPVVAGADEVAAAIREALEQEPSEKPVLAVIVSADGTPESLREAGSPVATFAYPESAARALGVAARPRGMAAPSRGHASRHSTASTRAPHGSSSTLRSRRPATCGSRQRTHAHS